MLLPESVWGNLSLNKYFIIGGFLWLKIVENALTLLLFSGMIKSMAKQDNYKKERAVSVLSFHFSDFGMRGYISMMKPSGLFLRFSFSFW